MRTMTVRLIGLLALAGVTALCVSINAPRIEAKLSQRANEALSELGAAWASVEVDGRDVLVRGAAPDEAAVDALRSRVGRIDGVRSVRLVQYAGSAQVVADAVPRFVATRSAPDTPVGLYGTVPESAAADHLIPLVELDTLDLDASGLETADVHLKGAPEVLASAVSALTLLDSGRVEVDPERIVVAGKAASAESKAAIEARLSPFLGLGYRLDMEGVELADGVQPVVQQAVPATPTDSTQGCQQQIDDLLSASSIRFANGSSRLHRQSTALLQQLAATLGACPDSRIRITGHTDSRGDAQFNQRLSEARAAAVGDFLIARGIDPERITTAGVGAREPIADNATAEGRARNRRIEITLEEKGE